MPTTLSLQEWNSIGSGVSLVAADQTGNAFPNEGIAMFIARNAGASAHTITFSAKHADDQSVLHSLPVSVPNDSAWWPIGEFDKVRFGRIVDVSYGAGEAVDFQVAAVRFRNQYSLGTDPTSPPSMGPSPGTVPLITQDEAVIEDSDFAVALADGMLMSNDGNTRLWAKNTGGAGDINVWIRARIRSDQGFLNDETKLVGPGEIAVFKAAPVSRFTSQVEVIYDTPTNLIVLGLKGGSYEG